MDDIDKTILNRIQSDFPRTAMPFKDIAEELGLAESLVLDRVAQLRKSGIIRRIGGNFVPDKLGYVSTLCAARVPKDKIDEFASVVNRFSGVTHNYERDNGYNVWFTFIASSMEQIKTNLKKITELTGVDDILNLPATRVYKINAHFDL